MTRIAALACLATTLLLTGCGGSGSSEGDDPATLAPADAPIYLEAVVRPEDDVREGAEAAFEKIAGVDDAGAEIRRLLEKSSEDPVDYERDVEPWLGERVGIWVTNVAAEEPGFTAIVATTDAEEALASLERTAKEQGERITRHSYKGTDYLVSSEDGEAAAAVEGFLVTGTEPELKRTIDVAEGDSLAESDRYTDAIDELPDERLGSFYFDQRALFEAAGASDPGVALFGRLFDPEKLAPMAGALLADADRVVVETFGSTEGNAFAGEIGKLTSNGSELLEQLPGDAWAAFGVADLGKTAQELYSTLAGALGGAAIEGRFREQTGLDLTDDVFGWIGDVAVYVNGVGEREIGGALVIEVTDGDRAANAFGKIVGLITAEGDARVTPVSIEGAESAFEIRDGDMPQPIVLARSSERVVAGYGRAAAESALAPADQLGDASLWDRAADALDADYPPAFVLDMGKVLANVDAFGGGSDPGFQEARPYLERFDVVVAGGEADGDEQRSRFAAGLK